MGYNKEPKQDELQINQQYVEELIYENMRLLGFSIRLMFENKKLRNELRSLRLLRDGGGVRGRRMRQDI